MYEKFTDRARKSMQLANQTALALSQEYIAPEHILCGILKEGSGVACHVMLNLNVSPTTLLQEVLDLPCMAPGPEMLVMGKLPQTPRGKGVIEGAIAAAKRLGNDWVGTEHLLLGLLAGTESSVFGVLSKHLGAETVENEIKKLGVDPWRKLPDDLRRMIDVMEGSRIGILPQPLSTCTVGSVEPRDYTVKFDENDSFLVLTSCTFTLDKDLRFYRDDRLVAQFSVWVGFWETGAAIQNPPGVESKE